MQRNTAIAASISALLLSGCATTIDNPSSYDAVSMPPADIMPSKDALAGNKIKVVIFTPNDANIKIAKEANTGFAVAAALEQFIAETGVEIVDRSIALQLKAELQLAEAKGISEYQGPNVADYAITGAISSATVSSSFTEERHWKDKKGNWHVDPAYCTYTAAVKANLSTYKLPGLKFANTVSISDSISSSQETRNSRCPISEDTGSGLIRKAAEAAVKDSRTQFQNYFSPKAYVLERRVKEDVSIFKLSAGNNAGFKPESTVTFYHLNTSKNPLTDDVSIEEYTVVTGTVSDKVGKGYAWVLVDDENAQDIKLGDYVKIKYEKGMFEF